MALFMKQDFTPPLLSRKWIAIKFRPNVVLNCRKHVIAILESGLLFREDSIEVERDAPSPAEARLAGGGGVFTRGERMLATAAVCACVCVRPPTGLTRSNLLHVLSLVSIPLVVRITHRSLIQQTALKRLLTAMREYLALARRAHACVTHLSRLCGALDSLSALLRSMTTLLTKQQSALTVLMSRASSSVLGNCPWLRSDLEWGSLEEVDQETNLLKIHHAFLVVQSTLLKHIAMAHYIPPPLAQQKYKNYNERLYWIHTVILEHLCKEFIENFEALDRMYRLLKNVANKDENAMKKPGSAITDNWLYSDVHSGIATACLELKIALNKCTSLDMLLDSCALNKQEIDLEILNNDIDNLIDGITKSLSTAQNAQLRLKKLQTKFGAGSHRKVTDVKDEAESGEEECATFLQIEDKEPEVKDEVFYYVKMEDDDKVQPASDVTTGPGKKERETTKVVLNELRRKLVKREDLMRERERQALVNTMPELKDNLPEFPRQNSLETLEKKGYITKLIKRVPSKRDNLKKKIKSKKLSKDASKINLLRTRKYSLESEIPSTAFEAKCDLKNRQALLTLSKKPSGELDVTKWCKDVQPAHKVSDSSGMSEGLSDVEAGTINKNINQAINLNVDSAKQDQNEAKNFTFTKRDLELTPSTSGSDYEESDRKRAEMSLLKDVRRHRVARKKNYPVKRGSLSIDKEDEVDEGLKPVEYSFGTGMAIASVLQVNNKSKLPNMSQEEVFIGDGEVSDDSGNDEDA